MSEDLTDHDLLVRIDERTEKMEKKLDDHECRIRSVEGNFFKVLGVGALVGFVTGWLGKLFGGVN